MIKAMKVILMAVLACAACPAQSVTIVNSGSTNAAGFQIVVDPQGNAQYTSRPRRRPAGEAEPPKTVSKSIPQSLAKLLYSDVEAARPLASLPPRHCLKSASFGTRLTIRFGDEESPDLSCGDGGNAQMQALIHDATAIVKLFNGE
jgi:hypothetical protein